MGYERRGASFTFTNFTPIGRTVRVVEDREEVPALARPPRDEDRPEGGTITLSLSHFVQDRRFVQMRAG